MTVKSTKYTHRKVNMWAKTLIRGRGSRNLCQNPEKFFFVFVAIVRVRVYYVDFFVSLVYVTGECYRFLHRG